MSLSGRTHLCFALELTDNQITSGVRLALYNRPATAIDHARP